MNHTIDAPATAAAPSEFTTEARALLDGFEAHYRYDVGYLRHLLETDEDAFRVFRDFLPMASFRGQAPVEVVSVAKLAAMQQNDCGACLQLTIRQAIEAGLAPETVRAVVGGGEGLAPELAQVRDLVRSIAIDDTRTDALRESVRATFGEATLSAIAIVVAAAGVFPTVKRVLGSFESCELMEFEFTA